MYCKNCGQKHESGKFCTKCGASIDGAVSVVDVTKKTSTPKSRRFTNKLLCKITTISWVISMVVLMISVLNGGGAWDTFVGILVVIFGWAILVFGIWGLIRLGRAKHKIASIIGVLTVIVLVFQKVEIIYDLSIICLFVSIIIGLRELYKLPEA